MSMSMSAGRSMLFAALLCARAFSQCSDDFSGSALRSQWTFIDADNAEGGSAVVDGKLHLAGKGADIYGATNQFVGVWRADIKGDFDVSVKIESQDSTHNYAQAGILVANNILDLSQGGYAVLDESPGHGYTLFTDKKDTVGKLDTHLGAGKTAYPAWLRLVKKGTQLSAYYKTSAGAAWSAVQENATTQGLQANSQIALVSLSHNIAVENKTVFDDFACAGATVTRELPRAEIHAGRGPEVDAAGRARDPKLPSRLWRASARPASAPAPGP